MLTVCYTFIHFL